MKNNIQTGQRGEHAAAEYLIKKGYKIIEQNYRYKRSEIDIIARKDGLLVFVEVKTKGSHTFGFPEDAVDNKKAQKVIEGADHYVHDKNWQSNIRFDVIAINHNTHEIVHFEDAFY